MRSRIRVSRSSNGLKEDAEGEDGDAGRGDQGALRTRGFAPRIARPRDRLSHHGHQIPRFPFVAIVARLQFPTFPIASVIPMLLSLY